MRHHRGPKHDFMQPGDLVYIYAFVCEGFVKVGVAARWQERLSSIQTACPFPVRKLLTMRVRHEIAYETERFIHGKLADHHHRGEWFSCDRAAVKRAFQTAYTFAEQRMPKGVYSREDLEEARRQAHEKSAAAEAAREQTFGALRVHKLFA